MKRFFFVVSLWLALLPVLGRAAVAPLPEPPRIEAGGYILIDFHSGKVLAEANADERFEPASLTKIMTAYVVFNELAANRLTLDQEVAISEKAWRTGGSKMFVEVGKRVRVEDLLQGMIIQSGNDASVALAEHVAGSESAFAEMMNAQAHRLGMKNSHFTNAPGLPHPELYSTPRDIALLTAALIREFPQYYRWYSQPEFVYNNIRQYNRNRLLREDPSVDGVKTGYTEAAGYCLVASAQREGRRLISVVMKTPNPKVRARDSLALLNYGFRFFETHRVFPGGEPVETVRVWQGARTKLPVGPASDVYVTIPRGTYDKLTTRLEKPAKLLAPLARLQPVGEIVVSGGGEELQRVPLVALQEVPRGNLLRRLLDTVLSWFA